MTYPAIVAHVKNLLGKPPLCGDGRTAPCELCIDQTGVGAPVGDLIVASGLDPVRITITASTEAVWGNTSWHVGKQVLISQLDAVLHTGVLKFAAALSEADAMKGELRDFQRKVSDAGRASYAARVGKHDDLVLSVAIACWWLGREQAPTAKFGHY